MHPQDTTLNEYVDGTLGPAERTTVDQHLATCAVCRRTVDDLREIVRATGELELREAPVRVWSRLERAIKMEREHTAPGGSAARAVQPGGADTRRRALLKGSRTVWMA